MNDLPRKAVARTARLAALPLGYAGRTALGLGKRMGGASAESVLSDVQQRTAEQLFRTLGDLKGGAMKFGQAMSIFEAALPEELAAPYREQLTRLQDSAPPMPTMTVRQILARELGADWKDQLVELEPVPAAAASIGQVHRGSWSDGREVAVKVQYPGAAEALTSDLRQLARVARGIGPMVPGLDIKPLIAELQAAHRRGARLPARGRGAARRSPSSSVTTPTSSIPDVVASSGTVLVTEWMESADSLAHIIRDGHPGRAGPLRLPTSCGSCSRPPAAPACCTPTRTRETSGCCPARTAAPAGSACSTSAPWHGCPNASCRRSLGALIRIATMEDYEQLVTALRDEGFIRERIRIDADQLRAYLGPFIEPASVEEFSVLPRLDAGPVPPRQRPERRGLRRRCCG